MGETRIGHADFVRALALTAAGLKGHVDELRDLDAALGDGDLGVTVDLGASAMSAYLNANTEADIGKMLVQLGMHVNRANPSTFGTLLASAFMGSGKAVLGKVQLTAADLLSMGDGAVDGIKKRGKAEAGDKTMLDSLVPAVDAFRRALGSSRGLSDALDSAASASRAGLEATAAMKAKFGRVSWRPDGGIGLQDGGAAAIHFLVSSFVASLKAQLPGGKAEA